jgi:hypothetical protein
MCADALRCDHPVAADHQIDHVFLHFFRSGYRRPSDRDGQAGNALIGRVTPVRAPGLVARPGWFAA